MLVAPALLVGCDGGGGGSAPPVGPDIRGKWEGIFFTEGAGNAEDITARIGQDGDAVVIKTSKSTPPGQRFTGSMAPDGFMTLTDASDGETWSTLSGNATESYIRIEDFVFRPAAGGDAPKNVIELRR
jgi:hypothetical protein